MDELREIIAHLTPDDVRTLIEFVDERYRASMGNFECIFPVSGDHGLRLLVFLESCAKDTSTGNLGMRTPTVRYYDLVQYAFLTVYHRPDNRACSVWQRTPTDMTTLTKLPDYYILKHGELSGEALIQASRMTGVGREGLIRLIELCKRGFHLAGTEVANQRVRWNENNTSVTKKYSPIDCTKMNIPVEPGAGRVKSNIQGAGGDGHSESVADVVESILGGAVSFHAQIPTVNDLSSKSILDEKFRRDSVRGTNVACSSHPTPVRKTAVLRKLSEVNRQKKDGKQIGDRNSGASSSRLRPKSMTLTYPSIHSGGNLDEGMNHWHRSQSVISITRLPDHPSKLDVLSNRSSGLNPTKMRASREAILDGTYLVNKDEYTDLGSILDAQTIKELTQSVRQKRSQIEVNNKSLRTLKPGIRSLSPGRHAPNSEQKHQPSCLKSSNPIGQIPRLRILQSSQHDGVPLIKSKNGLPKNETRQPTKVNGRHFPPALPKYGTTLSKSNSSRRPRRDANNPPMSLQTKQPEEITPRGLPAWI
ncbi:unnamed protein product [Echinostoma caproni]|uniref:HRDC domain-containing protein n=1 Tax=Echinostoma caproni TaxID=27848 RepID=A0A183AVA3_9TREM|nr:unnamed protein product [Echinostoma caproni]